MAAALAADDLNRYEIAHRDLRRLPTLMSHTMLLLDRSAMLRKHTLAAFSRRPALFRNLLEVHLGHQPMRTLGPNGLLATGLRILATPLYS